MNPSDSTIPFKRVHVTLPTTLPTDALKAELGVPLSAVLRAGLECLGELHRRSPKRARTLVARAEVLPGPVRPGR